MLKVPLTLVLTLLIGVSTAQAATLVDFTGATTGGWATGSAIITLAPDSLSFTGTLSNTSPFDAQLTAFGFDLGSGNLDGFTGSPDPITSSTGVLFNFNDGDLGNVPAGFDAVELDFGYLTGSNFSGGDPHDALAPGSSLTFTVSGAFAGFTEAEIAAGLLARFQRVGPNGEGSDVGSVTQTAVPEPASMLLVGGGLAYLARRRMRREPVKV